VALRGNAYFLVYDETISVFHPKRHADFSFRLRVWMGKHQEPVVLVSQCEDSEVPPSWMCSKIANVVFDEYLKRPREFRYFEVQYGPRQFRFGDPDEREVAEILFEYAGSFQDRVLTSPITRKRTWEDFESLVGEPIADRS
jgi:hypothetical protein